jgi:predicted site-specific integrase-resolvase
MNLSDWAYLQEIHPHSAYRRFREGTLPVPARKMGRLILVGELETTNPTVGITALYAQVSSGDQRADLDRQIAA